MASALPPDVIARRASVLADMLVKELARRWPEKYGHLAGGLQEGDE